MYAVGAPIHLTGVFADPTNTLVDPSTVTLYLTDPTGTVTPLAASRSSVGSYFYDYTPSAAGMYSWQFVGTGSFAATQLPDVFSVIAGTTTALVSLAEVRLQLNKTSSTDDGELLDYIHAATDIVNRRCGYTAPTTFTETVPATFDARGHNTLCLSYTPVLSVTSITPKMQGVPAVDITTLQIDKQSGVVYLANWFVWFGPQSVTYVAGRSSVPAALRTACILIVDWLWETQQGGATLMPGRGGDDNGMADGIPFPARAIELMDQTPYFATPGLA